MTVNRILSIIMSAYRPAASIHLCILKDLLIHIVEHSLKLHDINHTVFVPIEFVKFWEPFPNMIVEVEQQILKLCTAQSVLVVICILFIIKRSEQLRFFILEFDEFIFSEQVICHSIYLFSKIIIICSFLKIPAEFIKLFDSSEQLILLFVDLL